MAEEQPVEKIPPREPEADQVDQVKIRRGRVASVDLYEIKDSELDQIESGSPSNDQFNAAIFLLGIAITGVVALATSTFINDTVKNAFLFATIICAILGTYLIWNSWTGRTSTRIICRRIRERMQIDVGIEPPEATDKPSGGRK